MGNLSFERKIGGIILIGLAFYQISLGIVTILIGTTALVGIASFFFGGLDIIIAITAIFNILFGLLLYWAGRVVRNETFIPEFLKRL